MGRADVPGEDGAKAFGRVVQFHFYGWMKGSGTSRRRASFLVDVRYYRCQRVGVDLVLVAVGASGGDFADAVRFSCSIMFPLRKRAVKKIQQVHRTKVLRSQARNLYASAEVATFLLNEFRAEILLILDVGSEWHRGITEEAAEQKTKMIRDR